MLCRLSSLFSPLAAPNEWIFWRLFPQQELEFAVGFVSISIPSPANMSDPWQECMDLCVEVTKEAGRVSKAACKHPFLGGVIGKPSHRYNLSNNNFGIESYSRWHVKLKGEGRTAWLSDFLLNQAWQVRVECLERRLGSGYLYINICITLIY